MSYIITYGKGRDRRIATVSGGLSGKFIKSKTKKALRKKLKKYVGRNPRIVKLRY